MNDIKSDLEKVVIELSLLTDKVIFKGGIINLNMINNAGYPYHRVTKDIDLNTILNSSELAELIKLATETALQCVVTVDITRDKENSMSFDVNLFRNEDEDAFEVDANKVSFDNSKVNFIRINGIYIKSQSSITTLVDKLTVVTTHSILRRVKDLIDVYAILNSNLNITLYDIENELHDRGVFLGECSELINYKDSGKQGLLHAYNKQIPTSVNDSLEEIVSTVLRFLKAVDFESPKNRLWDNELLIWRDYNVKG